MKPYGLFADAHLHLWSQFASLDRAGRNSRLVYLLDEIKRVCYETTAAGGELVVFAGDLFHVRGSIDPEVFNEVFRTFQDIFRRHPNLEIVAIPGNHDLKGKDVSELGNSFQALGSLPKFHVFTGPTIYAYEGRFIALLPWQSRSQAVLDDLKNFPIRGASWHDLICHVGINGVIPGMPDHGLRLEDLDEAVMGSRLFAGHYHNHKVFDTTYGGKIVSIGAIAHHTWADVGSTAGFLLVYPDRIEHRASLAPSFIEVNAETDMDDLPLLVDGNYVRVRDLELNDAAVGAMRRELEEMGARGTLFEVARTVVSARTTAAVGTSTIEESIGKYIDELAPANPAQIKTLALSVLAEVQAAVD